MRELRVGRDWWRVEHLISRQTLFDDGSPSGAGVLFAGLPCCIGASRLSGRQSPTISDGRSRLAAVRSVFCQAEGFCRAEMPPWGCHRSRRAGHRC
eukprot:2387192-Rhodomonas_salina.1